MIFLLANVPINILKIVQFVMNGLALASCAESIHRDQRLQSVFVRTYPTTYCVFLRDQLIISCCFLTTLYNELGCTAQINQNLTREEVK